MKRGPSDGFKNRRLGLGIFFLLFFYPTKDLLLFRFNNDKDLASSTVDDREEEETTTILQKGVRNVSDDGYNDDTVITVPTTPNARSNSSNDNGSNEMQMCLVAPDGVVVGRHRSYDTQRQVKFQQRQREQ